MTSSSIHESFRAKKVVITGASGYIGTAITECLKSMGCDITLVSRHEFDESLQKIDDAPRIKYVTADLSGPEIWDLLIANADIVFHLSAQTNLRRAETNPEQDELANIKPVRELIESARRLKKSKLRVVFASTVTIVGIDHKNPVDESFIDRPVSVYDHHKLKCECLLEEAARQRVLETCTLRLSNVYGYGKQSQNENRSILNVMMQRVLKGDTLTVYGDGSYIRDFTHVDDVVEAFLLAGVSDNTKDGQYYIIATGSGNSLRKAFGYIATEGQVFHGQKVDVVFVPEPATMYSIEKRNFIGDSTRFQIATGWKSNVSLRDGIRNDLVKFSVARGE